MFFIKSIIQTTINLVITFKWFLLGVGTAYIIWLKIASWATGLGL